MRVRHWAGVLAPGVLRDRPLPEAPTPRERVHALLGLGVTAVTTGQVTDPALRAAADRIGLPVVDGGPAPVLAPGSGGLRRPARRRGLPGHGAGGTPGAPARLRTPGRGTGAGELWDVRTARGVVWDHASFHRSQSRTRLLRAARAPGHHRVAGRAPRRPGSRRRRVRRGRAALRDRAHPRRRQDRLAPGAQRPGDPRLPRRRAVSPSSVAAKGIGRDTTVVFYGDNFNWWAAYALWVFTLFGHSDVPAAQRRPAEVGRPRAAS